jgi:hypothetical protein
MSSTVLRNVFAAVGFYCLVRHRHQSSKIWSPPHTAILSLGGIPSSSQPYVSPRPVKGIALLVYMKMMFVPPKIQTNRPLRPVMAIDLLFIFRCSYLSGNKPRRPPRPVYGDSFTFYYVEDVRTSKETIDPQGLLR